MMAVVRRQKRVETRVSKVWGVLQSEKQATGTKFPRHLHRSEITSTILDTNNSNFNVNATVNTTVKVACFSAEDTSHA